MPKITATKNKILKQIKNRGLESSPEVVDCINEAEAITTEVIQSDLQMLISRNNEKCTFIKSNPISYDDVDVDYVKSGVKVRTSIQITLPRLAFRSVERNEVRMYIFTFNGQTLRVRKHIPGEYYTLDKYVTRLEKNKATSGKWVELMVIDEPLYI